MIFENAITKVFTIAGINSSTIIESGPSLVLGVQIQQENLASNTHILCNGVDIVRNWARDTPMILMSYSCSSNLAYSKTGNDTAMINITYSTSTTSSSSSSSIVLAYNGYTYGEIVSTAFLFYLAFLATYSFYWFTVHRPVKP